MDIVEIPSHFTELFLKDYDFVKKFAVKDNKEPISKPIFDKMIFCDEIF